MKVIILLAFFINVYSSEIVKINKEMIFYDTLKETKYILDKNNKFTYKDILGKELLPIEKIISINSGPFWTKTEIKNISNEKKNLVLYSPLSGTNYIDVYILKNKKLLSTRYLGDLRKQSLRKHLSIYSIFDLTLLADEKVTIVTKIDNFYVYKLNMIIQEKENYYHQKFFFIILIGIFSGILFSFLLYNLISYILYKSIIYLIICFNVFFLILYVYSVNGIIYYFNLGINLNLITTFSWILFIYLVFMVSIFSYFFFNIKEKYKKLRVFYFLNNFLLIFFSFIIVYAQYVNKVYFYIMEYLFYYLVSYLIVLFLLGAYMSYMKRKEAIYYILGQGIYILGLIMYDSYFIHFSYEWLLSYKLFLPLGILIDMIFFIILTHIIIKKDRIALSQNKKYIIEQSKYISIGQMLTHITHQLKNPLSQIGMSLTLLEVYQDNKKELLLSKLEDELPILGNNLVYLNNTLDEFGNLYSSNLEIKEFSLTNLIEKILSIMNSKIILNNVNIVFECKINYVINNEIVLLNILINLVDNSLEAFETNFNNCIHIDIYLEKDFLKIIYRDNAGGIKVTPINRIFENDISTKEGKSNKGIGLSIVKILVEEKLKGDITVKNLKDGVQFELTINNIK